MMHDKPVALITGANPEVLHNRNETPDHPALVVAQPMQLVLVLEKPG